LEKKDKTIECTVLFLRRLIAHVDSIQFSELFMKRRIIKSFIILLIILVLVYTCAYVPLKQWHYDAGTEFNMAYFADLYEEAKQKLGLFSGWFVLDHINILWGSQDGNVVINDMDFVFFHEASYKVFDACAISYQPDVVILSYMRDETKGFAHIEPFYFGYIDDPPLEEGILTFIKSKDINIEAWVLVEKDTRQLGDGIYRLYITNKKDGTVEIRLTNEDGFTIR